MRENPILIAGDARTGTTMLAYLLYLHGVWIGRSRPTRRPGSNPPVGSENLDITGILKRLRKRSKPKKDFKARLKQFVPEDTPWLFKKGILLKTYRIWQKAFPEALWVLPQRPPKDVLASRLHTGVGRKKASMRVIKSEQNIQDEIAKTSKYTHWVKTKEIVKYNKAVIVAFLAFCNIEPNWDVVDFWIQPGRMHESEEYKPMGSPEQIHQEVEPKKGS